MTDLEHAGEVIRQARGIVLITHCNPDGDGIGSQLGLYHGLAAMGKRVCMHNVDGVPRIYRFLAGADAVERGRDFRIPDVDLIVSLDAGSRARLGMDTSFFAGRTLLVLDHHPSNARFGDINLIDVNACATGEIVLRLLQHLGAPLTPEAASALYVALLTDTFCFRNSNTSAGSFELAAKLVRAGAEPRRIAREVYESHRRATIDLLRLCLATLEVHDHGRSAWLHVTRDMYEASGGDVEDTEGFIEYARSLQGVEVAVFIRPEKEGMEAEAWKVSFRSRGDADVGALAASLGGGGHRYAAGCSMPGGFDAVHSRVREAVHAWLAEAREAKH